MQRLINLCKTIDEHALGVWEFDEFYFTSGREYGYIHALNRSHTGLFKIRYNRRDIGVYFNRPHYYTIALCPLNDGKYPRELTEFNNVFDINYKKYPFQAFNHITALNDIWDIKIQQNNKTSIYDVNLLYNGLLNNETNYIGVDIRENGILCLNYKYGVFDVNYLIAPRITDKFDEFINLDGGDPVCLKPAEC